MANIEEQIEETRTSLERVQQFDTRGTKGSCFFTMDGRRTLMLLNWHDASTGKRATESSMWVWNGGTRRFEKGQTISNIVAAARCDAFTIEDRGVQRQYLAIAGYHDGSSYVADSWVYRA